MSTAGTIKSAKSDTKVMDMNHADGTSPGVMHMSDLHGRLNQHFFWMGPYIISLFDPDCVGTDATNNKAPEYQPTCVLQPYRAARWRDTALPHVGRWDRCCHYGCSRHLPR